MAKVTLMSSILDSDLHTLVEVRLDGKAEEFAEWADLDGDKKRKTKGWVVWNYDDLATLNRNEWVEEDIVPPKVTSFNGGKDLHAQLKDAHMSQIVWCAWVITGKDTQGFKMAMFRAKKSWQAFCEKPLTEDERKKLMEKRNERLAKGRLAAAARREAEESIQG